MDVYVGTSGWAYAWNPDESLAWFTGESGLNAVELNASFYRFPAEETVLRWADAGADLRWSVKVNRSVTHRHMFNEKAFDVWERFEDRFRQMDGLVDFYLFQAPPRMNDPERLIAFAEETDLAERFALEVRSPDLLGDDEACRALREVVTLVSVDSPDFQARIFPGDTLYLRMHGRDAWYRHDYTGDELAAVRDRIREIAPECAYVFFNNDHAMLENARSMRRLLA
jgi:uncharacterized protein YecE (DUF72 family)